MAGRSLAVYNGLADLCRARLRDSESPYCGVKEASYCTLRSQLIMALHDNNISEITSKVGILPRVAHEGRPGVASGHSVARLTYTGQT